MKEAMKLCHTDSKDDEEPVKSSVKSTDIDKVSGVKA
jgi:hypothetical protein